MLDRAKLVEACAHIDRAIVLLETAAVRRRAAADMLAATGSGHIAGMDTVELLGRQGSAFRPGIDWSLPDHAGAKALGPGIRHDGMMIMTRNDQYGWIFSDASAAVDASENLVMTPTVGTGAWLRTDLAFELKLPIGFGTADAAALFTVPAGMKVWVQADMWEVNLSFTGGAASAIGLSSSNANYNTKGDLLGGAAGDVAATLVQTGSPYKGGTVGAKISGTQKVVLVGGDTIRFDRITSIFTAGAGFAHLFCKQIL